jgi:hypothetical protein
MNDIELLRAYEPIVRYTGGEMFFPSAVDGYLRRASLFRRSRDKDTGTRTAALVAEAGTLDEETLSTYSAGADEVLSLRFVHEPMQGLDYQRWRAKEKPVFHAPGRLARVGLLSRIADALFSLSLLVRGRVPGGTAAAAQRLYQAIQAESPGYVYYGRVVREAGWTILHYHFFYCMNDWRSTFSGVNDHEADWEQMLIYLADEPDGGYTPAWIAFAAHDYSGDDLRRRWDDPEITKEGTHPVVYAGAGSHAAYFEAGEYVTRFEVAFLRPVLHGVYAFRRFWRDVLRQGDAEALVSLVENLVRVPFIDYARGDGQAIGPGQAAEWTPALIDDDTPWVSGYRGLWGLDTGDVLGGERAPAGPKYTREGTVRQSWYDPLGWAGLNKVAPPDEAVDRLTTQIAELERELEETDRRIDEGRAALPRLGLEVQALQAAAPLLRLHDARARELARQEDELNALVGRRVEVEETLAACRRHLGRLKAGELGDPQAHIHHKSAPDPPSVSRRGRLAELWAALSTSALLLLGVVLIWTDVAQPALALALVIVAVVVVEAIINRRIDRLLLNVTIALAAVTALVLIYEFFWQLSLAAVAALAMLILRDNVRELRGRG